ncbi:MAG: hypothetical protein A2066_20775 [Bacteroidetes bacterium GWB2_41_8]|nr:MAG: hypothetical protein A2066_20775 [Bacteroidetes bacterium GWB2_41_8]
MIHRQDPKPKAGERKTFPVYPFTFGLLGCRKPIKPVGRSASMLGAWSTWFIITFLKHKPQSVIRKAYYAQYPFGRESYYFDDRFGQSV